MRAVLENKGFRRLWAAQIILALGDSCMRMGLLEFLRRHGFDVTVESAKILFAVSVPGLVLGPLVMVVLDRWQRRNVLMLSDALRAVLVAVIAAWLLPLMHGGVADRSLLLVYGLLLLVGAITTFSYPARYALMPNLLPADQLVQANTLFTTTLAVANGIGLPLGGFVAERYGPEWGLLANVLAYVASIGLVWQIRMRPHATTQDAGVRPGNWAQLKDGLSYIRRHATVLPLVMLSGVFAFELGIFIVALLGYAVETLHLGTAGFSYLGTGAGVGAAMGVIAMGRARPWTRSAWLPPSQLILIAIALGLLALTRNVWLAAPLLVVVGAVAATVMIPIDAKLQEQVDDARRGAVFAARGTITSAAMVVAFWLQFGTKLLRETPPPQVLAALGLMSLVSAVLAGIMIRAKAKGSGS